MMFMLMVMKMVRMIFINDASTSSRIRLALALFAAAVVASSVASSSSRTSSSASSRIMDLTGVRFLLIQSDFNLNDQENVRTDADRHPHKQNFTIIFPAKRFCFDKLKAIWRSPACSSAQ